MRNRFAPTDGTLLTALGTQAFFDFQARRIRHGTRDAVPGNLALRIEGGMCRLLAAPADGGALLSCLPMIWDAGPCRLEPLDHPYRLIRADAEPGVISLQNAGAALQAEANGRLSLMPDDGSARTRFKVLTRHTLRVRDALMRDRWISAETGAAVPHARLDGDTIAIGGVTADLAGVPGPFVTEPADRDAPLRRAYILAPGGRLYGFARYRPLVCFAVFGTDRYYECLGLALGALDRHGFYDGAVCIASDRPRTRIARYIPEAFRERWIHARSDPRAALFSRYDMDKWGLEAFQPLLYLDVDVVANAPLEPTLRLLALSGAIHVATENRLRADLSGSPASAFAATEIGNWFGTWLCEGDPRFAERRFALGSSGILGFANIDVARSFLAVIRGLRRIADPALIEAFTDQALVNYALHVLGSADFAMLNPRVNFVRGFDKTPRERRGLVHFHSGVGDGDGKYEAMRRYLAEIEGHADP